MAIQAFFSETAPDIKFHPFGQNIFIRYKVVSKTAVEKVVPPVKNVTNQNLHVYAQWIFGQIFKNLSFRQFLFDVFDT